MSATMELTSERPKIKGVTNNKLAKNENRIYWYICSARMRNWNVQQNLVDSVVANRTNLVKEVEGFVVAMNDYEQDKYLNSSRSSTNSFKKTT